MKCCSEIKPKTWNFLQDIQLSERVRSSLPSNVAGYISTLPSFRDMALNNYASFSNFTDLKMASLGIPNFPLIAENLSMLGVGITNIGFSLGNSLTFRPQNMLALVQPFQFPRPGLDLRSQGLKPKHPILIVPGFVTSGLELWETLPCASQQKRWTLLLFYWALYLLFIRSFNSHNHAMHSHLHKLHSNPHWSHWRIREILACPQPAVVESILKSPLHVVPFQIFSKMPIYHRQWYCRRKSPEYAL